MIFGTFDHLHDGHRFLIDQARKRGRVIAVVGTDSNVQTIKRRAALQPMTVRIKALQDDSPDITVIAGSPDNFLEPIQAEKPDLLLLGYDQTLPPGISFEDLQCPWERAEALNPDIYKSSLLSRNPQKVIEKKDEK